MLLLCCVWNKTKKQTGRFASFFFPKMTCTSADRVSSGHGWIKKKVGQMELVVVFIMKW